MADAQRLVAIISPWENLAKLVKAKFRVETLPAEKLAAAWREDLQTEAALAKELEKLGFKKIQMEKRTVTVRWQDRE